MDNKNEIFNLAINKIMRIAKSANSRNEKLKNICKILSSDVQYYDWVGFYIADEEKHELNLGPFDGESTEHTKIQYGSGICGQAAKTKEIFIIQDISKETNYLSCSPNVKSEIVIPIMKNTKFIGELDIDSHELEPFSLEDKEFLENVAEIVVQLF
jgi:GAF domain-containing protein